MTENYTITFEDVSVAEANRLALELNTYLANVVKIQSELTKETSNTQDLGSILTIVLSSASVVAFVTGLANWLQKKQSRKITIKKNGDIIGENLSSNDVREILKHSK